MPVTAIVAIAAFRCSINAIDATSICLAISAIAAIAVCRYRASKPCPPRPLSQAMLRPPIHKPLRLFSKPPCFSRSKRHLRRHRYPNLHRKLHRKLYPKLYPKLHRKRLSRQALSRSPSSHPL